MKTLDFQKLLFKAAYYSMIVDGEIHQSEKSELLNMVSSTAYFLDFDYINEFAHIEGEIETLGISTITGFIDEIKRASLTEHQKIILFEVLFRIIEADEKIEDNEKRLVYQLNQVLGLPEHMLLAKFPKHIEWLSAYDQLSGNINFNSNISLD